MSINNPDFENYLGGMYPAELEILLEFTPVDGDCQLHTSLYDKRDDLNFHIKNFPFLKNNMPSLPVYGVLSHSSYDIPELAFLTDVLFLLNFYKTVLSDRSYMLLFCFVFSF